MAGVSDPVRSGFKTPDWFAQYIIIILQKNFSIQIQGVQEKLCFFTIDCNPSLGYIAVSPSKLSTQCECTVTPIGC